MATPSKKGAMKAEDVHPPLTKFQVGPLQLASDEPATDAVDMETKEVHAYGAGLESISAVIGLQRFTNLRSLSLHGNHISVIEGLDGLHHLENLNLSSNRIRKVEGISHLSKLKVLDLSSNFIEEIQGFGGLTSLVRLVLAHNHIEKLRGLAIQDGPGYSLKYLDIHDNRIRSLSELWFLVGCVNLQELLLGRGQQVNAVCKESMYVVTVISILPHLELLDGRLLQPQQSSDMFNCLRTTSIYCNTPFNNMHADQLLCYLSKSKPLRSVCHENYRCPPRKQDNCPYLLQGKDQFCSDMPNSWPESLTHMAQPKELSSYWQQMDNKEEEMCLIKASKGSHLRQRKTNRLQDSFNKKTSKGSVPHDSNWTIPNEKEYNSHKQDSTSHIGHAKIIFQKPNATNMHPEDLIFCEEEISPLEQVTGNSSTQIDHDLIGFYRKKKKKDLGNQKSHKLSVEKLDRLNSIEARLKFLESCTLHACNTLDAVEDESLCSAQILSEEVEENKQNDIRKKLLDQSEKCIVDNVVQVVEDSEKALKDFKHTSAFHTSNGPAKVRENNLLTKDSVYTQTDMFEGSNTGATCIEVKDKSTDVYSAERKERNNNCIGLQIEEESSKQKETPVETLIEHQRISELEAEMKEKDAEILRYKEGIMKMEEMMKVNGSLDSALHHERLLEVVVTAKTEILSLKETLDAMKHAKQVAETSLRDIVSERNQLRQALSKLSKSSYIKIQHLNAELDTCKDRELTSREEIKTLSSLLNLERIDFQRQLNESKLFSVSRLPQIFFLGLNSREGTLAYQHALVGQEGRVIDSENTWRTFEDSKELTLPLQIKEIAELKKELENMRMQSMKSEQLTIEVEMLRKKLEEAESHIADDMQKRIDSLTYENDKLLEQNKILSSNLSENNKLLEENKNLSSMLSENVQKVVATEDALRIKNKMLDSQNDSIRDLKSEIAALKKCITDKVAAMETMERNLTRKLEEERDKVHELQNELAEEEIIFSQIEEELKREKKANVEAEIAKSSLLTKLSEKDELLKYVESKIEHANQLYESREKAVILDKDKALENLQLVIKEKTALQSQCEGLSAEKKALEEREQKLMESLAQQSKESLELSQKLLVATASLNAQTVAQAKMKDAYSYKVNQLSKVLEELQDVSIS